MQDGTAEPADWTDVFRRIRAAIAPDVRDLIARAAQAELFFDRYRPAAHRRGQCNRRHI